MSFTWPRLWKHWHPAAVRTSGRPSRRHPRRPHLESLEDRTLPSTSIPLDPVNWAFMGPAPLAPGGDPDSGRVTGLAPSPTDPNTYYLASASGGVWKTTNAGASWAPLTDGQLTLFMGAIAVAPSDPNTIYAGTGEANLGPSKVALARDNIYYGRGVLKSTDGGATWTLLGQSVFDRRTISTVVVDPGSAGTVYVAVGALATNGLPGNTGVWKSTDGGATWADTTAAISTTAAFSTLVMDPSNPQVLYAGAGAPGGDPANGVYKTTDGGAHWAAAGNFPTGADVRVGRVTLAIAKSSPQTLYGAVTASGQSSSVGALLEMLKSTDGGATWSLLSAPNYMGSSGDYDTALAVDPSNANVVYAAGQADGTSIIKSSNGGASWSDISGGASAPHADHHALAFTAGGKLLDGNDGGIWRLDNPTSIQWTDLNTNLGTIQLVGVALHPTSADIAYAGSQDNGTEEFVDSLGWPMVQGGDGGFVRIDPSNPQTVYHTYFYQGPGFLERSDNGGASWAGKTSGINSNDPADFYPPYVLDPSHPSRLLLGTNRVYETTNRADSWAPISTPFANGWTTNARIDSLAVAPTDVNTIYASAGGRLFVTTNHGATWSERDPVPSPSSALKWKDIVVDPTDSQTAFAVAGNFSDVTGGGHVFRTGNGGATWTDVSGNLPDLPTWTIALAPNGPSPANDLLYVGNDNGVYLSTDGGTTWAPRGSGLPHVLVNDLELNPSLGILAAGTHGRGLWELSTATADLSWSGGGLTGLPSAADTETPFTITRTYNVSNLLPGVSVANNFTISYYASADTTIGNADDVLIGQEVISASADKTVGTHTGTSPALRIGRPGAQYIVAVLDTGGTVPETNETNNGIIAGQTTSVTGATDVIVDNADPGYAEAGAGWAGNAGLGYAGSYRSHAVGSGAETATWQLTNLPAGNYDVQVTWYASPSRPTNAVYQVYDGAVQLTSFTVNQQAAPAGGITAGGAAFQELFTFAISSGTLRVVLPDGGNFGSVSADAVHVASAPPAPTGPLPFSDNFNRPDAAVLGGPWLGTVVGIGLSGQRAVSQAAGPSVAVVNGASGVHVSLQATVSVTATSAAGLVARYSGPGDSNMYAAFLVGGSQPTATIWRSLGGTWTQLASANVSASSGTLRFDVQGTALAVYFNGVQVASTTDGAITGAGGVGLRGYGAGAAWDDFAAVTLPPPGTATLPYSDNFNRANSSVLGDPWAEDAGGIGVSGQQAVSQVAGASVATLNGVSAADVSVQATVSATATAAAGLVARYSGPGDSNMYAGFLVGGAQPSAQIWRSVGGIWTLLASAPAGGPSGTLRFDVQGTALALYFNGQLTTQAQDGSITAAGSVGLRGYNAGASWDDFSATTVIQPPLTPALPFSDGFNRANSSALGSPWSAQAGAIGVSGQQALSQASGASVATVSGVSAADVSVQATVSVAGASGAAAAGLVARYSGPGDSNMYVGFLVGSGGQYSAQIWRNVGGSWTMLTSAPVSGPSGTLTFTVQGNVQSLYFNGVLATQAQDGALTTGGSVGLRSFGAGVSWDDFSAGLASAALPFSDGFNRANSSSLGSPWAGQAGAIGVSGQQAVAQAAGASVATVSGVSAADVSVQATVSAGSGAAAGLVARYAGPGDSNMYAGFLVTNGSGVQTAEIWRNVGGTWAQLVVASVSGASGTLRFDVRGNVQSLYFNGALVAQAQDGLITAAGSVGLRGYNAGASWDDFAASALT